MSTSFPFTAPFTANLSQALMTIAASVQQFTVQISGRNGEAGSGIIWQADGLILTNAHVIQGQSVQVTLADGRILPATVLLKTAHRDLASLKVNATDLPTATIADSDQVRVGEFVLAVGNPLGFNRSIATGIIHTIGSETSRYRHWLQADIALAPGNSGGALVNAQGQVIGMNTMIIDGRGFAITSNTIQQWLTHAYDRPYLGITMQPVPIFYQRRGIGWIITSITPNSPATIAQLQVGDVITGVRGQRFRFSGEFMQILNRSHVGDQLRLTIWRGQQEQAIDVVLCNKDSQATAA